MSTSESNVEQKVERLESKYSRNKAGLWGLLGDELGDVYGGDVPTNLNTDFLGGCFEQISPGENPRERLRRDFDNYSEEWVREKNEQAILATALKLLLHERVGRAKHNVVTSTTTRLLAQIVVAIRIDSTRTGDDGSQCQDTELEEFLDLDSRPTHPFDDTFPFEKVPTSEFESWVEQQRTPAEGKHGVYVLDCTPASGEDEDSRIRSLRREVYQTGKIQKPKHKAAMSLNNGECVYYVGYTADLVDRMRRHAKGTSYSGVAFTALFKPREIVEVSWFDTETEGREYEKQRAEEVTESGGPYAYCETEY